MLIIINNILCMFIIYFDLVKENAKAKCIT